MTKKKRILCNAKIVLLSNLSNKFIDISVSFWVLHKSDLKLMLLIQPFPGKWGFLLICSYYKTGVIRKLRNAMSVCSLEFKIDFRVDCTFQIPRWIILFGVTIGHLLFQPICVGLAMCICTLSWAGTFPLSIVFLATLAISAAFFGQQKKWNDHVAAFGLAT